tara:strand:+ start:61 stop:450 length:390 start_codon:yes stop_codon:yes gene_type:complete
MDYQVIVKKNNDEYIFFIKELSIIHKSKNLEQGYEEINKKIEEKLENLKKYNLLSDETNKNKSLKKFFYKFLIIFLGLTFLISFSGIQILSKFNDVAVNLKNEFSLDVKEKIGDVRCFSLHPLKNLTER